MYLIARVFTLRIKAKSASIDVTKGVGGVNLQTTVSTNKLLKKIVLLLLNIIIFPGNFKDLYNSPARPYTFPKQYYKKKNQKYKDEINTLRFILDIPSPFDA